MDSSDTTNGKIQPGLLPHRSTTYLIILILALQVIVALATYPFLPDVVPSHWNAAGQIDGYLPKWINSFLFPAISIGTYLLVRGLYAISPRLGNQNQRANWETVNLIMVGILLLMLVMQLATTAVALNIPVDITLVISLALSALFMFIGNYMGKLRRNFWGGIRTPWTLASDTVWERTHRLGGWLFVLAGLLGLVISFIPAIRLVGLLVVIGVAAIIPIVYSYVIYQRNVVNGKEPLSPPFDGEGNI
jgi:uncharacterized membrane protein